MAEREGFEPEYGGNYREYKGTVVNAKALEFQRQHTQRVGNIRVCWIRTFVRSAPNLPLKEKGHTMVGVYKITNTKNGKVYIGQSVDISRRFKAHINLLRSNSHINHRLQDDWNVYGEDAFEFEVLEKCRSVYLNEIEKHTIREYDSTNEDKGYNISAGVGRDLSAPPYYVRRYNADSLRDYVFYRNDVGEIEYSQRCVNCERECKQSFRADILICPSLESQ